MDKMELFSISQDSSIKCSEECVDGSFEKLKQVSVKTSESLFREPSSDVLSYSIEQTNKAIQSLLKVKLVLASLKHVKEYSNILLLTIDLSIALDNVIAELELFGDRELQLAFEKESEGTEELFEMAKEKTGIEKLDKVVKDFKLLIDNTTLRLRKDIKDSLYIDSVKASVVSILDTLDYFNSINIMEGSCFDILQQLKSDYMIADDKISNLKILAIECEFSKNASSLKGIINDCVITCNSSQCMDTVRDFKIFLNSFIEDYLI